MDATAASLPVGSSVEYQVLFDLLPVPAWVYDVETLRFLSVNSAAVRRYGYSRDELLTMTLDDIRPSEDVPALRAAIRTDPQSTVRGIWRHRTRDGELFDVEIISDAIPFGNRSAMLVIAVDISERQQSEQRLRDANDQLRRVSARGRARREEDRTRLARELHDQLGQALAGLKIDLYWLAGRVADPHLSADDVVAKIGAMTALVDETIDRVRRLSSELRPPVLDRLGLIAAIEWQVEEFRKRSGIHVRLKSTLEHVPLDLGRATAVFRIFQEALANIASHAEATQVSVRLANPDGRLILTISDNGRGIADDQLGGTHSLGLIGMQERAELLGGEVQVRPGRPRGTVVTVSIPLAERRRTPRDPWT